MAEKPDVKTDPKPHVPMPGRPPERAHVREGRDGEAVIEGDVPLADPIQLTGAALIPPAVVDATLIPEPPPEARDGAGDVLPPNAPDLKALVGADQNGIEVLTGKRWQRESEPSTATKREREAQREREARA